MHRDYYCSEKFDWLSIRLYDGFVSSCCDAVPDKLSMEFLKSDPQAIFNWPTLIEERQQMLQNQRISGCEVCWKQEDSGLVSRRNRKVCHPRYESLRTTPTVLNIQVSNTCNLTCSYCCKNYSHSWLQDVIENGNYGIAGFEDRLDASHKDRLVSRLSQKQLTRSTFQDIIKAQIATNSQRLERVVITGGEPLLYNNLTELIESLPKVQIEIYTGLGLSRSRLTAVLDKIAGHSIKFFVSAENLGTLHEFNRYGSKYDVFCQNLQILRQHSSIVMNSTISNLSIFGFREFADLHGDQLQILTNNLVMDPGFMNVCVLDPGSKEKLINDLKDWPNITDQIQAEADESDRLKLGQFLARFCRVRSLDLDIYPQSFVKWINRN